VFENSKNYKSKHKWDYNFPKLSDNIQLQKEAADLAEMLEYYASFLKKPSTTALEISDVSEVDFDDLFLSIYRKLLTDSPSVHEKLREVDPTIVIPK
jgi:hypothetical protein